MKTVTTCLMALGLLSALAGCEAPSPSANTQAASPINSTVKVRATTPPVSKNTFDPVKFNALLPKDFSWGGLMYSKWWSNDLGVLDPTELPPGDNAAWIATGNTTTKGMQTWRCKSCHGWDYIGNEGQYVDPKHKYYTNIPGILSTAKYTPKTKGNAAAVFAVLDTGLMPDGTVIPDHNFGAHLTKIDPLYALTKFVEQVRTEADNPLPGSNINGSPTTIVANIHTVANQAEGYRFYNLPTCVTCHGTDGKQVIINPDKPKEPHTITGALRSVGVEEFHKLRFGQPGTDPVMLGLEMFGDPRITARSSLVVAADIFAYVRDGLSADSARGGRLYDDWPKELSTQPPLGTNALLKARNPNPGDITPDKQWMCSSCHAYNYEGIAGFSNNLVDLKSVRHWSIDYLYNYLKQGRPAMFAGKLTPNVHSFGQFLSDEELWHLAKFLMTGVTDTHSYISAGLGGTALGEFAHGSHFYTGIMPDLISGPDRWVCAGCHGENGNGTGASVAVAKPPAMNIIAASWSDTEAPWRVFHRIRFGMPGLYDLDGSGVKDGRMPGLTELVAGDVSANPPIPYDPDTGFELMTHRSIDALTYLQGRLVLNAPASLAANVTSVKQQITAKSIQKLPPTDGLSQP